MTYVRVAELAARQYNRFSRSQLAELGIGDEAIHHRLAQGAWVGVHQSVYAIAPALGDPRSRWLAATLTEPGTYLSHVSAATAWGWWDRPRGVEVVTRRGDGGPRRVDDLIVHYSETLDGDTAEHLGIPITAVPRTLLDLAPRLSPGLLARCVREAVRLRTTSTAEIVDALATRHRGRRGCRKLVLTVGRYSGLPLHRARSGAEVRAMEILRDAGRPMPELNRKVAGTEADLVWRAARLIIEIDGGPFHLDVGEDARKEEIWRRAGYTVLRLPADEVTANPGTLLAIAPNVHRTAL